MSLITRRSGVSTSRSQVALATAVLTILSTVFGLQCIRLFIPTLQFYLGDTIGLGIVPIALLGTAVFLAGFLAAPIQRIFGLKVSLTVLTVALVVARLLAQLTVSVPARFALSMAGTCLYLLYLPLLLGAARPLLSSPAITVGLGFLLGVATDSALHIGAGTYDLAWHTGFLAAFTVFVLAGIMLLTLLVVIGHIPDETWDVPWRHALPLVGIGPWLALQLILFQNPARAAAVTGWSLPLASYIVVAGNILGLAAALWYARVRGRPVPFIAGLLLVLIFLPAHPQPVAAAFVILIGQGLSSILLMVVFSAVFTGTPSARGLGRTTLAYGLGFLLFALLFFSYNAPYQMSVPFASATVLPLIALCLALPAALAPPTKGQHQPVPSTGLLAAVALVLLLAPTGLALAWRPPSPAPPTGDDSLRLLNYNLHNGFNVDGNLDMEALARVIEAANPDVLMLQEVSRGWVITGSLDMLTWLSQRLQMPYLSGPTTADRQWGNAILSRYPIVGTQTGPLPSEGLGFQRGYLQANVDSGRGIVQVVSTHLHQVVEDSEIRQGQVQTLLGTYADAPLTIIGGDFNAEPHHREIEMLTNAGLIDVIAALAPGPVFTSPAHAPTKRIDYIFISPDLVPHSFSVPEVTASDHFPIVAEIRLPE